MQTPDQFTKEGDNKSVSMSNFECDEKRLSHDIDLSGDASRTFSSGMGTGLGEGGVVEQRSIGIEQVEIDMACNSNFLPNDRIAEGIVLRVFVPLLTYVET